MTAAGASLPVIVLDRLGRIFPQIFWQRYSRLARKQGLNRLYLVLSFDCDTSQDAEAAVIIHERLLKHNVKATYAVPGSQLQENARIYHSIAENNGKFINHGARPHTVWHGDHYLSSAFYNLMTSSEVVEDIQKGDEIVTQVIGTQPKGFRGPHFGRFQRPEDLNLIYSTISQLGYSFATTTVPEYGFRYGPAHQNNNIFEFPLSGSSKAPISLLDSYTYINNARDRIVTNEYGKHLMKTVSNLTQWKICGLLNIYVDPSHVVKNELFYDALKLISNLQIPSVNYDDVVQMLVSQPGLTTK